MKYNYNNRTSRDLDHINVDIAEAMDRIGASLKWDEFVVIKAGVQSHEIYIAKIEPNVLTLTLVYFSSFFV